MDHPHGSKEATESTPQTKSQAQNPANNQQMTQTTKRDKTKTKTAIVPSSNTEPNKEDRETLRESEGQQATDKPEEGKTGKMEQKPHFSYHTPLTANWQEQSNIKKTNLQN